MIPAKAQKLFQVVKTFARKGFADAVIVLEVPCHGLEPGCGSERIVGHRRTGASAGMVVNTDDWHEFYSNRVANPAWGLSPQRGRPASSPFGSCTQDQANDGSIQRGAPTSRPASRRLALGLLHLALRLQPHLNARRTARNRNASARTTSAHHRWTRSFSTVRCVESHIADLPRAFRSSVHSR